MSAIRNDDLHMYEKKKRAEAEYCVITAAKLIAPLLENSFSEGENKKFLFRFLEMTISFLFKAMIGAYRQ